MDKYLTLALNLVIGTIMLLYTTVTAVYRLLVPYKYRSKSIKGEIVLVTGAGSGIGKLMAKRFSKLGARLVLIDVNKQANDETANEIINEGGNAKAFQCDLSNREDIYRVAQDIKKAVGDITILVNNAGIVTGKKFLQSTDVEIERTMNVNVCAHFWLGKSFYPSMIEKNHGHIVTIASLAGLFGSAGLADYCASKFGAVGFEESIRNELVNLKKTGVKTTLVCPYYINTGMFNGVESDVIPILEPEYVADKIVEAVLTDQKVLLLPRMMYIAYFFKSFTSNQVENFFSTHVFKTCTAMDHFVGRKKAN